MGGTLAHIDTTSERDAIVTWLRVTFQLENLGTDRPAADFSEHVWFG